MTLHPRRTRSFLGSIILLTIATFVWTTRLVNANNFCQQGEELLPTSALCLHGAVTLDGVATTGATVSVNANGTTVTTTATTSDYALDISALQPNFLQPMTVTITVAQHSLTRQLTVLPDFGSQSQSADFHLTTTPSNEAPLWGSVIDFGTRAAVDNALVTAEVAPNLVFTTTTAWDADEQAFIYQFDDAALTAGSVVTISAEYNTFYTQQTVTLATPHQQNLITGWQCDRYDPLPSNNGGFGLPDHSGGIGLPDHSGGIGLPDHSGGIGLPYFTGGYGLPYHSGGAGLPDHSGGIGLPDHSGGIGLPDHSGGIGLPDHSGGIGLSALPNGQPNLACLWGYIDIDGELNGEISVHLEISGTHVIQTAHHYPGEMWPRYGVAVWGGAELAGQLVTARATYAGSGATATTQVQLDAQLSQRTDLHLRQSSQTVGNYASFAVANEINGLVNSAGIVWAATNGGVVNWQNGDFQHFSTGSSQLPHDEVRSGTLDAAGNLWWATYGAGIAMLADGGTPTITQDDQWLVFDETDGLTNDATRSLVFDNNGVLWIGTSWGVSAFDNAGTPFDKSDDQWASFLVGKQIPALAVDSANHVWIGTIGDGLHVLDYGASPFDNSGDQWATFTTQNGLLDNIVQTLAIDAQDNLWMGVSWHGMQVLNVGASPFDGVGDQLGTYTPVWGQLPNGYIEAMVWDGADLWIGTPAGGTRFRPNATPFNPTDDQWDTFTTSDGLVNNRVRAFALNDGMLHLGTIDGISRFIAPNDWQSDSLSGGLSSSETADVEFISNATAVATDEGLNMFNDNGTSLDLNDDQWLTYTAANSDLADDQINSLHRANAILWVGSSGGLNALDTGQTPFDSSDDQWATFTTQAGLAHNDVRAIAQDGADRLWLATANGLSVFDGATTPFDGSDDAWHSFSVVDGLPSQDVRSVSVSAAGQIWIGTTQGVAVLDYGTSPLDGTGDQWVTLGNTAGFVGRAITQDNNLFWLGTNGGAFLLDPAGNPFDSSQHVWRQFTASNGLNHSDIGTILVDKNGDVWLGSVAASMTVLNHNQSPFDSSDDQFTILDPAAGFGSLHTYGGAKDGQDRLWFATANGLSVWETPLREANLRLHLDAPLTMTALEPLTVTVSITNTGDLAAVPTLTLTIPTTTTLVSASIPATNGTTWQLPELAPDAGVTFSVILQPDATWEAGTLHFVRADVTTDSAESFTIDNALLFGTYIREYRPDVRVSIGGEPTIAPSQVTTLTVLVDNEGGHTADNTRLNVTLPSGLSFISASPAPTNPLEWTWQALAAPDVQTITITVQADASITGTVNVVATVMTDSAEAETTNNTAHALIPVTGSPIDTIILIAPQRLAAKYGVSSALTDLYTLAQHPAINGIMIDVERDAAVQAAFANWDANPSSAAAANQVATAVKGLIDFSAENIVLVGSDDQIPFYRIVDDSPLQWDESGYVSYFVPQFAGTTVGAALADDLLLTDDFYATQTPVVPPSSYWQGNKPLYLPERSIGRLVESPADISAIVDRFIAANGVLAVESSSLLSDGAITADWGQAQCNRLTNAGVLVNVCTSDGGLYQPSSEQLLLTGSHANHYALGQNSSVFDLGNAPAIADETLFISISCHAGLSLPDQYALAQVDSAQVIAGQGGILIGSTAYAFAGTNNGTLLYMEALGDRITAELTSNTTVGQAVHNAKLNYYQTWATALDHSDEKTLSPMTLYGLPMWSVNLGDE